MPIKFPLLHVAEVDLQGDERPVEPLSQPFVAVASVVRAGITRQTGATMHFVRLASLIAVASACGAGLVNAAALPSAIDGGNGTFCHIVDGGVQCWGNNKYGQLGNGTVVDSAFATDVAGLGAQSGVTAISVGFRHACAIANGGAKCWGDGIGGQLGSGTTVNALSPTPVIGLESGVVAISAGYFHTCAVKEDGTAWCWGSNGNGELGIGPDTVDSMVLEPVQVNGLEGVIAIAAGSYHTCAVTAGGAVACWGSYGLLGSDAAASDSPIPVAVSIEAVSQITTGESHTCALSSGAGNVYCWGSGSYGKLGNGPQGNEPLPEPATDANGQPLQGIAFLSAGANHTCAVTNQGAAKCFGQGFYGALGNPTLANRLRAWPVQDLDSGVLAIAAGVKESCAITSAGTVCWGSYGIGSLGDGRDQFELLPVQVEGGLQFQSLSAGVMHTCAIVQDGFSFGLWCWGDNDNGQFGIGSSGDISAFPLAVSHPPTSNPQVTISAGERYSCATVGGAAMCWGYNGQGRLGDGTTTDRLMPTAVSDLSTGVSAIDTSLDGGHTCAVVGDGARCWGNGGNGRLGFGGTANRTTPAIVNKFAFPPEPLTGVTAIAVGNVHTCAIVNGGAQCWGGDDSGQLGNGAQITGDQVLPTPVEGLETGVSAIDAGGDFACAIHNGAVMCWGSNSALQLGTLTGNSVAPAAVPNLPSAPVVAIATGRNHACALTEGGDVWCWGAGDQGQLGGERPFKRASPKPVPGLGNVVSITAGAEHTCATLEDGTARCWGTNWRGRLGNGDLGIRLFPQQAVIPAQVLRDGFEDPVSP